MTDQERQTNALLQAGEALDAAMMKLVTSDSIHIMRDPQLVNSLHQALNVIVSVVGKPWREKTACAPQKEGA